MLTSVRNYWCQERGHCQCGDLRCLERPGGAAGKGQLSEVGGLCILHSEKSLYAPKGRGSVHFSCNTQLSRSIFGFSTFDRDIGRYKKYFPFPFTPMPHAVYVTSDPWPGVEDCGQLGHAYPSSPVQAQLAMQECRTSGQSLFLFFYFFFLHFLAMPCHVACGILVSRPGI